MKSGAGGLASTPRTSEQLPVGEGEACPSGRGFLPPQPDAAGAGA